MRGAVLCVLALVARCWAFRLPIDLNGFDRWLPWEGLGALSAGADAALLFDYEPARLNRILDLLFTPFYPGGASLQILKVEIPGDVQSTCGSESSHEHFAGDLSYNRGYEYRLMAAARQRNPQIKLYALEWSVPGWVGNGSVTDPRADYSPANRRYTLDWLRGARDHWNITTIDYLGFWNEPGALAPPEYILALRGQLDQAGFGSTKLVALDSGEGAAAQLVLAMAADQTLMQAVHAFGFHGGPTKAGGASWLPGYLNLDRNARPKLWASEDGNLPASMSGAQQWGATHTANWLALNVTATIRWSLIWSAYPGTICNGAGLLRADQPWSGRFQERAPNLAATAHYTWFTRPGMFQLQDGRGSGSIPGVGAAVTWVEPATGHFTVVIESLFSTVPNSTITLVPKQSPVSSKLRVYESRLDPVALAYAGNDCELCKPAALMQRLPDLECNPGSGCSLPLAAGHMYSITTLPAPQPHPSPPLPAPAVTPQFPLPLMSDYSSEPIDSMPRFLNNYEGSFSIAKDSRSGGLKVLRQWAFQPPLVWHFLDNEPLAILAPGYQNYAISSHVRVELANASNPSAAYASVCGRMGKLYRSFGPTQTGYCLELRAGSPPPPPPPSSLTPKLEPCSASSDAQRWTVHGNTVQNDGRCLTLPIASIVPADCGLPPLPPCPAIPNGAPLTLTECEDPPLPTQRWRTALEAGANRSNQWIQFDGPTAATSPCVEVNMGSPTPKLVDTWSCRLSTQGNELWSLSNVSQLVSGLGGCLQAPHGTAPPPPPPSVKPMWRLVAHAGYRLGQNMSDGAQPKELVLGSGQLGDHFNIDDWHLLRLAMNGSAISAYIDDNLMVSQSADGSFDHGLAGLGSGWNTAYYTNVSIVPLAVVPPPGAAFALINTNTGLSSLSPANGSRWFGVKVRLSRPVKLTALARFRVANSTAPHNVSLFASSGSVAASATIDIQTGVLDRAGFVWQEVIPPVLLSSGEYVLASMETPNGGPFYFNADVGPCAPNSDGHDGGSPWLLPQGDAVDILGSCASAEGGKWAVSGNSDQSQHGYGPVNMAIT